MFLNSLKYSLIAFGAGFVIGIVVTIVNYVRRKKSKRRNIEFGKFKKMKLLF